MTQMFKTAVAGVGRQFEGRVGMGNGANNKTYDLEERTEMFARAVRVFVKRLPARPADQEDGRQLIRSSGSVGANYLEANEALSKKDFVFRIRICVKEAKESRYWLRLIDVSDEMETMRQRLEAEAQELLNIFGAILRKSE